MIGYQNSWLQFLRLLISRLRFGLVGNLKKSVAVTQIVGYLVGYHLFSSKNLPVLPNIWLRFAAVVYPT